MLERTFFVLGQNGSDRLLLLTVDKNVIILLLETAENWGIPSATYDVRCAAYCR